MKRTLFITFVLSLGMSMTAAMAANVGKNNDGTLSLNQTGTWSGGVVPTSSDVAVWDNNSAYGTVDAPLNLGADASWGGISLSGAKTLVIGYDKTGEGADNKKTLTIGASGIRTTGGVSTVRIGANVVVNGNQTWGHDTGWRDGNAIVIDGSLTGSGNIAGMSGANSVTLNGDASGYTGAFTIAQYNALNLNGGTMTGGNISLTNGARLNVNNLGTSTPTVWSRNLTMQVYDAASALNVNGGKLTMSGTNSFVGTITVANNAELRISGASTFNYSGAGTPIQCGTTIAGNGTVFITGTSTISDANAKIVVANGATLDITSGTLRTSGYTNSTNMVTVQGTLRLATYGYAGSLSNIADYAANRLLDGGTIEVVGTSHSAGQGTTVSSKGGSFLYNPGVAGSALTLSGSPNSNAFILNGNLNIGGAGTINLAPDTGARALLNGSGNVTKVGSGMVNFNYSSSTSDWSGNMAVNEGTLTVSGDMGRRNVTVKEGATLNSGTKASITALAGSGNASLTGIAVSATGLTGTSSAVRGSSSNMGLTVTSAYGLRNLSLSNTVVTIQQAATLTLADVTVNGRTTSFSGTNGTETVSCSNTAFVLAGAQITDLVNGNVRTVDMNAAFGNVLMTGSLNLDLKYYIYTPDDSYQYLAVRLFDNTTTFDQNFDVNLINSDSSWAIASGTIEGIGDADWRTNGGTVYVLVPEPASATLCLLGLASLALRRRRCA